MNIMNLHLRLMKGFWYLKLGSSQNVSMLIVLHAKERPQYILTKVGERLD